MNNIAKRVLGLLLCLLMSVSMMTCVVLPAAAEDADAITPADPYAKITGTEGIDAFEPAENVFFFDALWAESEPASDGGIFDYTYGDGQTWGNGVTYNLIWGTNAFASWEKLISAITAYSVKWAANPKTVSRDIVVAFAAGEIGKTPDFTFTAQGSGVPTVDQLVNVYFLGAQAGKNPVNDKRDTKEDAKELQNGRSVDAATETVLLDTFEVPAKCNFTLDGFAGSENACILSDSADQYTVVNLENYYVTGLVAPFSNTTFNASDQQGNKPTDTMWFFKNCYFDYNLASAYVGDVWGNAGYDEIEANRIVFDNCFFTQPNSSGHHRLFLMPILPDYATQAANFLGEYTTNPEIVIKNCIGADWGVDRFIYLNTSNNRFIKYPADTVKIEIKNNKFYDVVGLKAGSGSSVCIMHPAPVHNPSHRIIIEGNFFAVSQSVVDNLTDGARRFIEYNKEGYADPEKKLTTYANIFYRDNIFMFPNGDEDGYTNFFPYRWNSGNDNNHRVDMSGNLYVDLEGNVLPTWNPQWRGTGHRSRSDLYVSAAMKGGIRETFYVKDIKGGAVIYNYISLDVWATATSQTTWEKTSNPGFMGDYLIGALTLLLERGKEYTVDKDLFTFGDSNVVMEGVYANEACTGNKITKLTQDMFANDAKYYLKASFSETAGGMETKATVVYCLNTPQEYIVIAPAGSSYDTSKKYTFNGITYENGKKASDGVTAKFFNQVNTEALNEYDFPSAVEGSPETYYPAIYDEAADFCGVSMFLLTPGVHTTDAANGVKNMETKSRAFVGPQFASSPYGADNAEGKLAGGRSSTDETKEAIIDFCVRVNAADLPVINTFNGVVLADDAYSAISNNVGTTLKSIYQQLIVKNCVFSGASERLIQGTIDADNGKVVDVYVKDSAFDALLQDRSGMNQTRGLFDFYASFVTIENFALFNKNCAPLSTLTNVNRINNAAWASARAGKENVTGVTSYATNHIQSTELTVDKEATCGDDGSGHYECLCGTKKDMQLDIVIPATNDHKIGKLEIDVAPLCDTVGIAHKDCTVCLQEVESNIEIPMDTTAHSWEESYTVDREATCIKAGAKSIHCARCDTSKPGTTVTDPILEHIWEDTYTVDIESTCNLKGKESIHCALCDTVKNGTSRELPTTEHVWSDKYTVDTLATCKAEGSKSFHCIYCDESNTESAVKTPKTEHIWEDTLTVDIPATCTKDGQESYHCKNCDEIKDARPISAEHTAIATVYLTAPTYQKGGEMAKLCEGCGTVFERWAVEALEGKPADTVFTDVNKDDWFSKNEAVTFVYNMKFMMGVSDTEFAPNVTLSRGMFVTILGRLSGAQVQNTTTKFKDVPANAYYSGYVAWAEKTGVVSGISATAFAPNAPVTREQICAMIYRYCDYANIELEQINAKITFVDANKISTWAKEAVEACQRSGLINGEKRANGYAFRPQDSATRAEAATIIRNFCYNCVDYTIY